ncbi:MAG: glutathione S-transferase family protein [Myxococcales bacterium]
MIKLFYVPNTRATRPRWMLEELGVPYDLVRLDPGKGENRTAEYLRVHPLGQVPALVDGATTVLELAAICAWLADRFPEKGFVPAPGSAARAAYYQWLFFAAATLEPPVADYAHHTSMWPEAKRIPAVAEEARQGVARVVATLEQHLTGRQFLAGDALSAADIVVGSIVGWARSLRLLEDAPAVAAWWKGLSARPAFRRARAD